MKYYDEIERKVYIPTNVPRNINHNLDDLKLPKSFYDKYDQLFKLLPKIEELFNKFDVNKYYINKPINRLLTTNTQTLYIEEDDIRTQYNRLKSNYIKLNHNQKTIKEGRELIQYWGNVLEFMYRLDNSFEDNNIFIKTMQLFSNALVDIGSIDGSLYKDYLSGNWLLTSRGYLYNTRSTAHRAGNFENYFKEKEKWFLEKDYNIENVDDIFSNKGKINCFIDLSDILVTIKNGYMRESTLDVSLHSVDYYKFNYVIFDMQTLKTVIGMIEIEQDLYYFLKLLDKYTDNPKEEFLKAYEICSNDWLDFLIICCGVSKITANKTIVTSLINCKEEFKEYLEKGYDICFIPPIIINKEKRCIEQLNMDSLLIKNYVENEIISNNENNSGKIYTNHLKY